MVAYMRARSRVCQCSCLPPPSALSRPFRRLMFCCRPAPLRVFVLSCPFPLRPVLSSMLPLSLSRCRSGLSASLLDRLFALLAPRLVVSFSFPRRLYFSATISAFVFVPSPLCSSRPVSLPRIPTLSSYVSTLFLLSAFCFCVCLFCPGGRGAERRWASCCRACADTDIYTYVYICTYTHISTYTYTYIHACIHAYTYTHIVSLRALCEPTCSRVCA